MSFGAGSLNERPSLHAVVRHTEAFSALDAIGLSHLQAGLAERHVAL
jgi:hypothetical protein